MYFHLDKKILYSLMYYLLLLSFWCYRFCVSVFPWFSHLPSSVSFLGSSFLSSWNTSWEYQSWTAACIFFILLFLWLLVFLDTVSFSFTSSYISKPSRFPASYISPVIPFALYSSFSDLNVIEFSFQNRNLIEFHVCVPLVLTKSLISDCL